MASSLTLYTAAFSSNGRKTVALARELGLHPKIVEVNVYRGEGRRADFLALNPFGKVPTLVDGELCLWESNAILIYLAEAHGGFRLWSAEPRRRAELARWLFWESAHWQPVLTQVLSQHAGHIMVPTFVTEPTAAPAWDAPALVPLLSHLEQRLNEQPYLAGSEPTLADFSVVAMTIYFRRLGFPFERYPALTAWYTRMHALESWKSTSTEPWVTG